MLKRLAAAAAVALLLLPAAAFGEQYNSDKYGFSADFPSAPTVGDPTGSEKDKDGNFVSTSVMFTDIDQGVSAALIAVDSYVVSMPIDVAASLTNERDNFVKGMSASTTSSRAGTLDGSQALFFSYDRADHGAGGSGVVVIIETAKPRIYVVATMHTPSASAERIADLDRFVSSFHLK